MTDADTTWAQYKAAYAPYDAPPGFLRWLRNETDNGARVAGSFATRDGVLALLAAWQAGEQKRGPAGRWW